jgi:hypothetical protein
MKAVKITWSLPGTDAAAERIIVAKTVGEAFDFFAPNPNPDLIWTVQVIQDDVQVAA